ncbi:MAG: PDZ domain-containing protein [Myxococcales bacterium]|nr:PDZ domain-containing protein [Myxococcales bacterium]MCB9566656.1 PDZ domain-containing protein [Myxococcales bacterium]MCB9704387.1 PDZ domain-containing protein [Myxococcales bacterium]
MPRASAFLAFLAGVGVTLTLQSLWPIGQAEAGKTTLTRSNFEGALDTVLDRYVDPVDHGRVLAAALKHVVSGLDDHSHFLTADERKALKKRGQGGFAGMSVHLHRADAAQRKPAWIEVTSVFPGSPAARVGITPGDQILNIDGHDAAFMFSQAEVQGLLAGAPGGSIDVFVQRRADPSPRMLSLVLAGSDASSLVESKVLTRGGKKHAHIIVRAFRSGVGEEVKRSLAELRRAAGAEGLAGIILDLRGNPGGDVQEAVAIADLFVAEGVLVRTRGRGGQILREEIAHRGGSDETTPLVVIQDRHSASAAELLAATLQDHRRAQVIGELSYGKGTVQDVIGMPDGSVLTLTIARYFSPKDRVVDGNGVDPDIHVSLPPSMLASRELPEVALEAALRGLAAAPQRPANAG